MIRETLRSKARWLPTALLGSLIVGLPLPFGGALPWVASAAQMVAFLSLAGALLAMRGSGEVRPVALPVGAAVCVALLGAFQTLPLPETAAGILAPESQRLASKAAAIVPLEAEAPRTAVSLSPGVTVRTAWSFLGCAAALLAAAVAGHRRRPRRLLGVALALALSSQLLLGLKAWFAGSKAIWGVYVEGDAGRLRGAFVNPNHFALFLEIGLAVAFAAGWWSLRRTRFEPRWETKLLWAGPPLLAWLGLFTCLAFTGSRAGLAAGMAGTVVQAALVGFSRRSAKPLLLGLAAVAAGVGVVAATGMQQGLGRWLAASSSGGGLDRLAVYRSTVELASRAPWLGTGLGTFRESFPMVQPAATRDLWWHAHSDPLELLATAGLLGAAVAFAGIAALVRRLIAVERWGPRSEDRAAALAALGAIAAVALHESVDFGLTMPANAYLLTILCGAAAGAARNDLREGVADPRQSG